ncbi:MAG: rRNA maturation RNase YbeY [Treponema sp.]|jgi:probable rRNA maturation factor|nr:rRNA maturation RNase YbeY [Treponema sp.]
MNTVVINVKEVPLPSWSPSMSGFAQKVLEEIKRDNWELSILLCGDKTIKDLNSQYRSKNEATDILSFNLGTEIQDGDRIVYLPGDIVISLDTLRENARYFGTNEDEELRRLIIHGILHLDGMDHETLEKNEPMLVLQEDILTRLKGEHIFTNMCENI